MRALIAMLLLAAGVASCGGGGSSSPQSVSDAPPSVSVLFAQSDAQPVLINDPGGEDQFPRDIGFVAAPISQDDRGLGLHSNSWTAPTGGKPIKTMNYSWMPSASIKPWEESDASVCTSFKAAVPESLLRGGALGSYAGADVWLRDGSVGKATSGKVVILSGVFFVDATGDGPRPDVGPSDYLAPLNAVHFSGPVGASNWFSSTAGSLRNTPWNEPAQFGYCLSREQAMFLIAAASDMLGGVMDIHDVEIKQALLSNETNLGVTSSPDPTATGALLSTFFSNWTIYLERPAQWTTK
jgi:hypothetical protein